MAQREIKRLFVIIVYLLLFILAVAVLYFLFKSDPSCFDGRHNQGEEAVDCGGPCVPCPEVTKLQPIEVQAAEWVHDIDNKYDIVAEVRNPNDVFGVARVRYRATVSGASGETIDESGWNDSFILPGETKYFFVQGFETESLSAGDSSAGILIDSETIDWKRFKDFEAPNLIINNPGYREISGGEIGFGQAFGTIINRSNVDLETVLVKILLRDKDDKLLAVNSQVMNTLRVGEFRDYVIGFPHRFPGSVIGVKAFPESNPFDSENYIRVHGRPDKWDENY